MAARRDPDDLAREGDQLVAEGRNLRGLSDRLLEEIDTLRSLESRARELRMGSPEFEDVSREITDRVRDVFRMSARQVAIGAEARQQGRTINEMAPDAEHHQPCGAAHRRPRDRFRGPPTD